jgi:mannitol-1-/sugar-/sorbitol-6-phosphatase
MTSVNCSALLFDMDGVLVDSTPAVARVWHRWALEHGFDPDDVVKRAHGRPSITTIRELLPNSDIAAEDRKVERAEIEDLEGVIPLPGVQSLLNGLPPERWTIVTSCTRPLALVRLQAAGLPVPKKLITSTDIQHGKPHPEPYTKAAALLGYPTGDCVVVEDAPAGIRAGKSAGARVIAFPTTMDRSELKPANPDWILNNCADIFATHNGQGLALTLSI